MLINKKKIIVCLIAILIAISTYSYGTSTGVITGETVKLREAGNLQAKLIMLLSINDKVEVLDQEGDWYKVNYKDNIGYVYKDYVKVEKDNKDEEPTEAIENNEPVVNEETVSENNQETQNTESEEIIVPSEKVISEETEVKIIPLINSSSVNNIVKDTKVTVIEYKNGWAYIVSSDVSGWIRYENLKDINKQEEVIPSEEIENTETAPEKFESKAMYVNVSSVRVRKSASTSSEIVDSLVINSKVIVTGEENDWYKVKVNNVEGYIVKKYLSDKEVEVTNRSTTIDRTEKKVEDNSSKETNKKEEPKKSSDTEVSTNGSKVVEYAKTFLKCKYVSGGSNPNTGFDCSGFTWYVYKHFGYNLNRSSSAQINNGREVSKSELQLGDLVLFSQGSKNIGHVGIYIGENRFIHAANPTKGVVITSLSDSYYKARYVTARRILN